MISLNAIHDRTQPVRLSLCCTTLHSQDNGTAVLERARWHLGSPHDTSGVIFFFFFFFFWGGGGGGGAKSRGAGGGGVGVGGHFLDAIIIISI